MMRKISYENRMLASFLRNYLFAIIIPLVVGIVVNLLSIHTILGNAETIAAKGLDETVSRIEQELSQLERTARFIANSEDTAKFALMDETQHSEYYSRMVAYTRKLNTLANANEEHLSQLYVYWRENEKIATAETSYDFSSFYPYFFSVEGMNSKQFQMFLERRVGDVRFETGKTFTIRLAHTQVFDTAMLVYPFSVNKISRMDGCVFILLNKGWLVNELATLLSGENSWAALVDGEGNIIAQGGSAQLPDQMTPLLLLSMPIHSSIIGRSLIHSGIQTTGWSIICLADSSPMMRQALVMSRLFWTMLLAALLVGLFLSYFLARSNAQPVARLVRKLSAAPDERLFGTKAYGQLSNGIDRLLLSNTTLESRLNEFRLQMPSLFLNRLYTNVFSIQEDLQAMAHSMGIALSENENHVVVLFEVPDDDRPNDPEILMRISFYRQEISTFLREKLGERAFISEAAIHRTALLFSSSEDIIDDELEPLLIDLLERVRTLGMEIYIAVGSPFYRLRMAYASYNDANGLLNARENFSGSQISWYWRLSPLDRTFDFPSERRHDLASYAESGSTYKLSQTLSWLHTENFINRQLTHAQKMALCDALEDIVRWVIERTHYKLPDPLALEGARLLSGEARFSLLCTQLKDCCAVVVRDLQSSAHQLAEDTRNFVYEHYMDPEMGLKLAASKMQITETYLSRIFKKAFHVNFASYVEQLRIQRAKEYLKSDKTIAEISLLTGYGSDHAFRRAFKRITGISPQEYRGRG